MTIPPRIQAKHHMFMPGDTVSGAIKKVNLYDLTREETDQLLEEFKKINPGVIPKPGMNCLIPVLERHRATVFAK